MARFLAHRVSIGFWSSKLNKLEYVKWLGNKLQIEDMEGWYSVTAYTFHKHRGDTLLSLYNNSPAQLITDVFPNHNWIIWKFKLASNYFNDMQNQKRYMDWLGSKLNYNNKSDYYNLKLSDFTTHYGDKLLMKYNNSPSRVVSHVYSDHDWKGWLFSEASNLFWKDDQNVKDYMEWLGKKIEFNKMEDWYQIRCVHFFNNKGRSLLIRFGSSPFKVVTHVFKDHPWEHFRFHRLPKNSKKIKEEALSIVKSAEYDLKITTPEDWYRISKLQLREVLGETLVKKVIEKPDDLLLHLQSIYPHNSWDKELFMYFGTKRAAQRLLRLTVTEIIKENNTEDNTIDILEDYVHPTIKISDSQNITFDIFIPTLNMAYEYGGQQHYDGSVFGEQNKRINDGEKKRLAESNGIVLITVPYWWDKKKGEFVGYTTTRDGKNEIVLQMLLNC